MAKKIYKVISQIERLENQALHKKTSKCKFNDCVERIITIEPKKENDRIVNVSVTKTVNAKDNFANYKVSDFTLENLQASGAIQNLKMCSLAGSPVKAIDSTVNVLNSIEDKIK